MKIERIVVDEKICHGQPCIKGTRIMVYQIIELMGSGLTPEQIIKDYYPQIAKEDIKACLHYASSLIKDQKYISFEEVV